MKRKHYTLLEFLVGISVIAIIAGMLFPALNAAREKRAQKRGNEIQYTDNKSAITYVLLADSQIIAFDKDLNKVVVKVGNEYWYYHLGVENNPYRKLKIKGY